MSSTTDISSVNKKRLMSIDALRGFDMLWIIGGHWIFIGLDKALNHPVTACIHNQLKHVEWEGFRFEDLIMPLFLFIVGAAMPFSFGKRLEGGESKRKLYLHVVRRVLILWVLGMMCQGKLLELDLSVLRVYSNTLQTIAVGYFFASVMILHFKFIWQVVTTIALLLLFWGLMVLVPIPGYGAGVLEPGCNLALYIDKLILGQFRAEWSYTWILSGMTFICTVMLGVMAGHLLRSEKSQKAKVVWLFSVGVGCLVVGMVWNIWFPIIKHLWTSSFVLFAGGWSYLLLAVFYLVIDVWGFRKWAFGFVVIGMNAIAVYTATRLFDFREVADVFVGGLAEGLGQWHYFTRGVIGLGIIWLVLYWMYRKKSFIRV